MERCRGGTRRGLKFPLSPINRPNVSKVLRDHCPPPSALVVNNSQHPCHVRPTSCRAQVLGMKSGERESERSFLDNSFESFPFELKKKKLFRSPSSNAKLRNSRISFHQVSPKSKTVLIATLVSRSYILLTGSQANLFRRTLNLL